MCGIVYVRRADGKPAQKQILKRYHKQRTRGYEGFGYVCLDDKNCVEVYERHQYEKETKKEVEALKSTHILFHHRFPTSTPNIPESAHPIKISHKELKYDYYVVHNGIISNDDDLKIVHEGLGYKYSTEIQLQWKTSSKRTWYGEKQWNDSEALAIELARNIDGKAARSDAQGAIAYIVMQVEKASGRAIALYYGTNGGNPLTIWNDELGNVCIASEGGKRVIPDTCYRYDLQTLETIIFPQVKMKSYGVAGTIYGYSTSGLPYTEREPVGKTKVDYTDWDTEDVEMELEDIQAQIEETEAGIDVAMSLGEMEEEAELVETLSYLKDCLRKAQNAYDDQNRTERMPF